MAQPVGIVLTTPPPPSLQEATKYSTTAWQAHLEALFNHAKDRFPDVVWELVGDEEDEKYGSTKGHVEEVWGHKAIVYARAPPSFQSRYFSFRPHSASSPLPYASFPAESALSLGFDPAASTPALARTPSPFRSTSPSITAPTILRLTTSINPTLFANELEYLYTGKGFGEAFEFLFDSSEAREHGLFVSADDDDPEALRLDKLRKDLVFMWRSRLYSDVRISLTGNFGGSHESTTAIFSSHRFILVSRSSYFHTALLSWPSKSPTGELPTLTLPSPPFTPASLHFTLGFIYTGTLVFSHRSYDLSTAFALLRAALYLALPTLHDEVQARIVQEMCHGLFHAFLPFAEYERITAGRWGTGGCRCRQCARRAPRVLEFSVEPDVKNPHLERGARRALVGLFGEGWCTVEFASLLPKIRESVVRGVGKRTTPLNAFALLWAAEHALGKLEGNIEVWADTVKEMVLTVLKGVDEVLAKDAEACFESDEWMEIIEGEGGRFEDGERVEWAMRAVMRGVKEPWAPALYQTLVSSILLRPHPTEVNAPQLAATSHIRVQVEQTRLELLKWIGKRWLAIRHERGFDALEGWAIKEISDHIEVPVDDLLNPPAYSTQRSHPNSKGRPSSQSALLLHPPISNHPHTSKVDPESEAASSMRVSVLSRNLPVRSQASSMASSVRRGGDRNINNAAPLASSTNSFKSVARSTTSISSAASGASGASNSTVSATPRRRAAADPSSTGGTGISPAKRLANEVRAGRTLEVKDRERPDSKFSEAPSIVEPEGGEDEYENEDDGYREDGDVLEERELEEGYGREGGVGDGGGYEEGEGDGHGRGGDEGAHEDEDENERSKDIRQDLDSQPARPSVVGGGPGQEQEQPQQQTPPGLKKTLITRASLTSIASKTNITSTSPSGAAGARPGATAATGTGVGPRLKSSSASIKSTRTLRKSTTTTTSSVRSPTSSITSPRPSSRGSTRSTATSRLNISVTGSGSRAKPKPISRPTSRLSTSSSTSRRISSVSTATDSAGTYRTASTGGGGGGGGGLSTPTTARSRRTSGASTSTSNANVRTPGRSSVGSGSSPVNERARRISGASVSSVASAAGSVRSTAAASVKAPPPPPRVKKSVSGGSGGAGGAVAVDPGKLSPATAIVKTHSSGSTSSVGSKKAGPVGPPGKKPILEKRSSESVRAPPASKAASIVGEPVLAPVPEPEASATTTKEEKENVVPPLVEVPEEQQAPAYVPVPNTSSTMTIKPRIRHDVLPEHKKTSSSASSSSVATLKKQGSADTIKTVKSSAPSSKSNGSAKQAQAQRPLPATPKEEPAGQPLAPQQGPSHAPLSKQPSSITQVLADYVPEGATLDIGIPCIIASKRKRFKAYARYIGEVHGETGPWVGVEVPLPIGDTWGDRDVIESSSVAKGDDRQWNDGSWGGIRYFEIGNAGGSEMEYGEDRAARRRRTDAGSVGGAVWGRSGGGGGGGGDSRSALKREGDQLSIASDRMKRMRSVSPAVSDMSGTESRGLFVRPQQVLYVVDAVGSDL